MIANPFILKKMGIVGMNQRNCSYIQKYNPRKLFPLVDDKLKTKRLALKHDVNVPPLYGEIRHYHQIKNIEHILSPYNEFVIKPTKGSGGNGILVIKEREGDHFIKASGDSVSLTDVKRHISNTLSGLYSLGGQLDIAMIEGLVNFSDVFKDISYLGVPDIRIIVARGIPIMAMIRLATKESDGKANLHQGAVGVGIDISTGITLKGVRHNKRVMVHPDTGAMIAGIQIPQWDYMLWLAAKCYDMTGLGYIGVDLVLDQVHGPLLLELNARPGLAIQIANSTGLATRMDIVEQLISIPQSVDERILFSKQHF